MTKKTPATGERDQAIICVAFYRRTNEHDVFTSCVIVWYLVLYYSTYTQHNKIRFLHYIVIHGAMLNVNPERFDSSSSR